ncbi:hypothetical protein ABZP36_033659 [Zizania latifolia]
MSDGALCVQWKNNDTPFRRTAEVDSITTSPLYKTSTYAETLPRDNTCYTLLFCIYVRSPYGTSSTAPRGPTCSPPRERFSSSSSSNTSPVLSASTPITSELKRTTGVFAETAFAGAAYYLLLYMLASHVRITFNLLPPQIRLDNAQHDR